MYGYDFQGHSLLPILYPRMDLSQKENKNKKKWEKLICEGGRTKKMRKECKIRIYFKIKNL